MTALTATSNVIPGPRGLPLLGKWTNMIAFYRDPFATMRRLHQQHGDVVALAQGDPTYVFAFGPEHNHTLLANPDLFANNPGPFLRLPKETALGRLFLNNLPVMNGEHHRRQRRIMQPAFHKGQILAYHADMVALTQAALERWQPGAPIDLLLEMKKLTLRIAVKTLFGAYDEAEMSYVGDLLRRATSATTSPLMMVAPYNIPGLPFHRVNQLAEQLAGYVRAMIVKKRAEPEANDVLAALVHARDEDGTQLSEEEMIGHAFTLFVAGHETTTNALSWTLFLLGQHPQVHADLVDEVASVLHGDAPMVEQVRQLPLLDGVIKESLRLLPPAPIGIRVATEACALGGYALPKGANIFYSEFITHRLPAFYTEPDRFQPARWTTINPSPYEYLPFAAGVHRCIGAEFALQEMKVVLAMVVQRYRLSVAPQAQIGVTLAMRPNKGMPMRVFAQDRQFAPTPVRGKIHELIDLPQG